MTSELDAQYTKNVKNPGIKLVTKARITIRPQKFSVKLSRLSGRVLLAKIMLATCLEMPKL